MLKTDESKEYVNEYLKSLTVTKNVRYAASSRFSRKNNLSLFTVSVLSIYVIIASIVPIFMEQLTPRTTNILYLFSIVCSLFIIALSLLESNKDYKTRSELLLKCARRITILIDRLKYLINTDSLTRPEFEKLQDEYNKLLSEFTVNHDEIDYVYYLSKANTGADNAKGFRAWSGRFFPKIGKRAKYLANIYLYYLILLLVPLAVLLIL